MKHGVKSQALTAPPSPLHLSSIWDAESGPLPGSPDLAFPLFQEMGISQKPYVFPIFPSLNLSSHPAKSADRILLIRWGN